MNNLTKLNYYTDKHIIAYTCQVLLQHVRFYYDYQAYLAITCALGLLFLLLTLFYSSPYNGVQKLLSRLIDWIVIRINP